MMFYIRNPSARWRGGDVPWVNRNYPSLELLKSAMKYIEDATGNLIRFSEVHSTTSVKTYLVFCASEQNFARVGRRPGENTIELKVDSINPKRAAVHEISHALGIAHEHQSPNRDQFVKINVDNIAVKADQFATLLSGYVFEEPYDFESISHYDPFAASRSSNLKTIEIVRPQDFHYYDVMGLKDTFSDSDIKAIKKMYPP